MDVLDSRQTTSGTYQYKIAPGRWVSRQRLHQLRKHQQNRARQAVLLAIQKGLLVRQPCEVCGVVKVQAHHADYGRPLDVQWLCKLHHELLHHPKPETMKVRIGQRLQCRRCGKAWHARQPVIKMCPTCKTRYFNVPRKAVA